MAVDIGEALNLQSQGKLDEARKIYLEFLKENPKQPDVSNLLGLIYLQQSDFDTAEKYFQDAVAGFPCAEYFQNLGLAYYRKPSMKSLWSVLQKPWNLSPIMWIL